MKTMRRSMILGALVSTGVLVSVLTGCASEQVGVGSGVTSGSTVSTTATTELPSTDIPTTDGTPPTTDLPTVGGSSDSLPPPTDGPTADATPLIWLTSGPGLYCDTRGTLVPQLVVYSDFSVLKVEDGIGAHCESVPSVSTGWIDRRVVADAVATFQDNGLAGADLRLSNVMDAGTGLISLNAGGDTQVASVYALGLDVDVPADQVAQRAAVQAVYTLLQDGFHQTGDWVPDRLTVSPGTGVDTEAATATWPSDAPGSTCREVPEADVAAVLEANGDRDAAAEWKVDGRKTDLALGLVLPGFEPCASVVTSTTTG